MNISVAMITYNSASTLDKVLAAASLVASEIVLVDNGSTDATLQIAKNYGAKVYSEEWKGYGPQKNSALAKCSGDYILALDSDEVLSEVLIDCLQGFKKSNTTLLEVFEIRRENYVFKKKVRFGGWRNDYTVRLFKRGIGKFSDRLVHEKFLTEATIGKISAPIKHYTYQSIEQYIDKINRYSTEAALEMFHKGKHKRAYHIFLNPLVTFVKMYFLKLGILDGVLGLFLASASSIYTMMKYYKLKLLEHNNK